MAFTAGHALLAFHSDPTPPVAVAAIAGLALLLAAVVVYLLRQ
jgi:hypothetical protein